MEKYIKKNSIVYTSMELLHYLYTVNHFNYSSFKPHNSWVQLHNIKLHIFSMFAPFTHHYLVFHNYFLISLYFSITCLRINACSLYRVALKCFNMLWGVRIYKKAVYENGDDNKQSSIICFHDIMYYWYLIKRFFQIQNNIEHYFRNSWLAPCSNRREWRLNNDKCLHQRQTGCLAKCSYSSKC